MNPSIVLCRRYGFRTEAGISDYGRDVQSAVEQGSWWTVSKRSQRYESVSEPWSGLPLITILQFLRRTLPANHRRTGTHMAVTIPVVEMAMDEGADFLQGLPRFGEPRRQGVEDMGHALPHL